MGNAHKTETSSWCGWKSLIQSMYESGDMYMTQCLVHGKTYAQIKSKSYQTWKVVDGSKVVGYQETQWLNGHSYSVKAMQDWYIEGVCALKKVMAYTYDAIQENLDDADEHYFIDGTEVDIQEYLTEKAIAEQSLEEVFA